LGITLIKNQMVEITPVTINSHFEGIKWSFIQALI
jgi:hypothetical protein